MLVCLEYDLVILEALFFFLLPWLISFKPVEMTEPLSFLNFFFTLLSSRAEFMNEFKKAS